MYIRNDIVQCTQLDIIIAILTFISISRRVAAAVVGGKIKKVTPHHATFTWVMAYVCHIHSTLGRIYTTQSSNTSFSTFDRTTFQRFVHSFTNPSSPPPQVLRPRKLKFWGSHKTDKKGFFKCPYCFVNKKIDVYFAFVLILKDKIIFVFVLIVKKSMLFYWTLHQKLFPNI